jgi:uncharacterized protein GlcG (DUF336 family)
MTDSRAVPTVTHDAAQRVVSAAQEAAASLGVPVCIAVADPGGNLVAFVRMDGAPLLSAGIAQNKAYTVSAFNGVPTHEWYGMLQGEPALLNGILHTDRLVIFGGGVPLNGAEGGTLIGAIGVSGGSAEQDREIAEAGARALHS